jgi:sulfite exporter TauE/SafE
VCIAGSGVGVGLSVLVSAWLLGTLGGLHCFAMCGGLLTAVAMRDGASSPLLPARTIAARQLGYQAGRIATYAMLGTAFGAAGAFAMTAVDFLPLQRALYLAANLLLLVLGVNLALGTHGVPWLQRRGAAAFGRLLPVLQPLLQRPGMAGRIALGLAWGLVPCALVYSVLPLALLAGGAWQGGAVMLAFGLGTLPNLLASGVILARARRALEGKALRYGAATVLIGFALAGAWRVVFSPGTLAQGPFCLVV